jgi:hypothetical protein
VQRKLDETSNGLNVKFFEQHSVEVAGVLDIKWCHGISGRDQGPPLFGAVDSNGDLSLWSLNSAENAVAEIQFVEVLSTDDNDALALSLDWSTAFFQRYTSHMSAGKFCC